MQRLQDEAHQAKLAWRFEDLYKNRVLTDVILFTSDGMELKAHWLILAAYSEIFKQLAISRKTMKNDCVGTVVRLEFTSDIVAILLNYCYKGELILTPATRPQVHKAAQLLLMNDILKLLEREELDGSGEASLSPAVDYTSHGISTETKDLKSEMDKCAERVDVEAWKVTKPSGIWPESIKSTNSLLKQFSEIVTLQSEAGKLMPHSVEASSQEVADSETSRYISLDLSNLEKSKIKSEVQKSQLLRKKPTVPQGRTVYHKVYVPKERRSRETWKPTQLSRKLQRTRERLSNSRVLMHCCVTLDSLDTKDKVFMCGKCNRRFTRYSMWRLHYSLAHLPNLFKGVSLTELRRNKRRRHILNMNRSKHKTEQYVNFAMPQSEFGLPASSVLYPAHPEYDLDSSIHVTFQPSVPSTPPDMSQTLSSLPGPQAPGAIAQTDSQQIYMAPAAQTYTPQPLTPVQYPATQLLDQSSVSAAVNQTHQAQVLEPSSIQLQVAGIDIPQTISLHTSTAVPPTVPGSQLSTISDAQHTMIPVSVQTLSTSSTTSESPHTLIPVSLQTLTTSSGSPHTMTPVSLQTVAASTTLPQTISAPALSSVAGHTVTSVASQTFSTVASQTLSSVASQTLGAIVSQTIGPAAMPPTAKQVVETASASASSSQWLPSHDSWMSFLQSDSFTASVLGPPPPQQQNTQYITMVKCSVKGCSFAGYSTRAVNKHMHDTHLNLECSYCMFACSDKEELERHIAERHERKKCRQFACSVCGKKFSKAIHHRTHEQSHHGIDHGMKEYPCDVEGCEFRTLAKHNFLKHKMTHEDKLYSCQYCGIKIRTMDYLQRHINKQHLNIRPFQCEHCGSAFGDMHALKSHISAVHVKKKEFKCEHCNYAANIRYKVATHMYQVHSIRASFDKRKEIKCPHCSYTALVKSWMTKHMDRHATSKNYTCDICGKTFGSPRNLSSHTRWAHKTAKHQCPHCEYITKTPTRLKNHIKTQHMFRGYKPYSCPYCPFKCATGGNCRKHVMQKHPGEHVTYMRNEELIAYMKSAGGQTGEEAEEDQFRQIVT